MKLSDDDVKAARQLAATWHADQRYGEMPYLFHLNAVVEVLRQQGAEPWQLCAGYLHDVLEDTECPEEFISSRFGADVLAWVKAVSGVGNNRKERQTSIVRNLEMDKTGAVKLKLADRLANVRQAVKDGNKHLIEMYRKDLPLYAEVFERASPELHQEIKHLLA